MTAQAKYVVIRDGSCTVMHHNTGAYEILELAVMGSAVVDRYLRAWLAGDPYREWDDEILAEGGLLVDWDQRVLILFTCYRDPGFRAVALATIDHIWPGWRVRWAYRGLRELAEHAGIELPPSSLRDTGPEPLYYDLSWIPALEWTPSPLRSVVTIGDTVAYALPEGTADPWRVGPGIVDQFRPGDVATSLPFAPEAGLHLDPKRRHAGLWCSTVNLAGLAQEWPRLWPGWRLELWDDRYDRQVAACDGLIDLPGPDLDQGREELAYAIRSTWLFYVPEHLDNNYATLCDGDARRIAIHRKLSFVTMMERTAPTLHEVASVLEHITGETQPNPSWLADHFA